jgi:hypothetical protein
METTERHTTDDGYEERILDAQIAAAQPTDDDDERAAMIDKALAYYREHYGPATREDIEAAASPRRNWHTLAELRALDHAGIPHR